MKTDWKSVAVRLKTLRSIDPTGKHVFGAKNHRFLPARALSLREIRTLEALHEIEFPEDYRDFLSVIGSGPGPEYGIYALDDALTFSPNVADVFPFQDSLEWPDEKDHPLLGLPGLLNVSTAGCGIDAFIEVNGGEPGTIWLNAGPQWIFQKGPPFGQWYLDWLDRVEFGLLGRAELSRLVKKNAAIAEIEAELGVKHYRHLTDPKNFVRFEGIPAAVLSSSGRAVLLSRLAAWIQ